MKAQQMYVCVHVEFISRSHLDGNSHDNISGEPSVSEGYFILFRIKLQMPTSNSYQTATPYNMLFIRKKKLLQKS